MVDQAAGLRRAPPRCAHILVLGCSAATASAALALAQACTQAWGEVLVADPAALCFSLAGAKPLFCALEARAVAEAAGCRLLLPPAGTAPAALLDFAEQLGSQAVLHVAQGQDVELPLAAAGLWLVLLGGESAAETTYAWLKTLAARGLKRHALVYWLGSEAAYLRLAEAARRFLSWEIAGEVCLPGDDPACAARALAARMRGEGQTWSRVRLYA